MTVAMFDLEVVGGSAEPERSMLTVKSLKQVIANIPDEWGDQKVWFLDVCDPKFGLNVQMTKYGLYLSEGRSSVHTYTVGPKIVRTLDLDKGPTDR